MGRAHRGNADRAQGPHRDHFQFPRRTDHRRRSDAGVFELWEIVMEAVVPAQAGTQCLSSNDAGFPLQPAPECLNRGGNDDKVTAMTRSLIVPISSAEATDADRFGPKAANLARLGRAGLPIPDGFCVDAEAYRIQLAALGLEDSARGVNAPEPGTARRAALAMKLGLFDHPIVPEVLEPLLDARRALVEATDALMVVRSSALVEDRFGSSFADR